MPDELSELYQDLLIGSYDCVDRIVLNGYFRQGHSAGGFRVWWRQLFGSDESLDNTHLMRLAGRFGRRIYGYAQAHKIPVIKVPAGEHKHELAEEYLAKTKVTHGLFLILVGRTQAPVCSTFRTPGGRSVRNSISLKTRVSMGPSQRDVMPTLRGDF